jgi:hypothetical protein
MQVYIEPLRLLWLELLRLKMQVVLSVIFTLVSQLLLVRRVQFARQTSDAKHPPTCSSVSLCATDDEFGEKTVSVLLDGEESEMIFIDHPSAEMSVSVLCFTTIGAPYSVEKLENYSSFMAYVYKLDSSSHHKLCFV